MLAGWGYTGGPKPYGYLGLGELFVFVFFGLVATVGTTYVVDRGVPGTRVGRRMRRRVPGVRAAGHQQPARHPHRSRVPASAPWPCGSATAGPVGCTSAASRPRLS